MKTKTQKDIKKEVIIENILKALHIVGYASIGILALLGIVMGVQSCKSKNSHNNDSQQQLRQPQMAVRETNDISYPAFSWGFNERSISTFQNNLSAISSDITINTFYPIQQASFSYSGTAYLLNYVSFNSLSGNNYTIYFTTNQSITGSSSNSMFKYTAFNGTYTIAHYKKSSTATNALIALDFTALTSNTRIGDKIVNLFYLDYLYNASTYQEGYETGVSEGYESGYSEGYEVGYSEGQENATPSEGPQNETIYLSGYDYRGWFGNVDSDTGLIQYQVAQATYLTYGGVEWKNKGNGRIYNFVSMVVQPVEANLLFAIGKEMEYDENTTFYNGRTGQQLYGSDYNKFSFVSRIYYGYKENYNGGEMESGTWDYRDTIYEMPMVSCRNTEASFVAGWLSHDYNIATLYRNMEIIQDSGTKFNTPKYNDVSIVELWKMDLNNYIGISNPTTEVNVFTMLSKAFNSITSVLSIEILPHMTLGLFLFVPLVVGIVFAVIKVIKK